MIDTTRTHRCLECPLRVEHTPGELCFACGRCDEHCHQTADCEKAVDLPAKLAQLQAEVDLGIGRVV